MQNHFDVLIVGAGLSGICAAYYLGERCPQKSFAILEGRDALGGTWDLFRYPGIRSDSDMYTLGFSFYPWKNPQAIADGPAILAYLHETAEHFGIKEKIQVRRQVERASWSSEDAQWTVSTRDSHTGDTYQYTCDFLWCCAGYYNYDSGHSPRFEGQEQFAGEIVHPQHWPEDIDWEDRDVVVIGSGATAVTLVPELARRARHVTMLQRSPTYVISRPEEDSLAENVTSVFGAAAGFKMARWKNVFLTMLFYEFSRRFPAAARRWLLGMVKSALGEEITREHFSPTYNPWDQRLCLIPDDDLFDSIRDGHASVVTDHIDHFTASGIELQSGEHIDADLIVTATGLQLQLAGGAEIVVDGEPLNAGGALMYKGAMLSGVPNAAISLGYTNASWTLKCELISGYVCRLLRYMDDHGHSECRPVRPSSGVQEIPLIDFNSGYVERALPDLPNQGTKLPWRLYQNYILDQFLFGRTRIDDGALEFS